VDESHGFSCCLQCGRVVEDIAFASDVQFQRGADGEGGMVGQLVGEGGQARGQARFSGGRFWPGQVRFQFLQCCSLLLAAAGVECHWYAISSNISFACWASCLLDCFRSAAAEKTTQLITRTQCFALRMDEDSNSQAKTEITLPFDLA